MNASSNESVFGSHPGSSGESGDDAVSSSTGDGGGSGSGLGSGSNSNDAACVEVGAGGVSASPDIGGLLCIGSASGSSGCAASNCVSGNPTPRRKSTIAASLTQIKPIRYSEN